MALDVSWMTSGDVSLRLAGRSRPWPLISVLHHHAKGTDIFMELQTTRFGALTLDDHRLVEFEGGIPGFPEFVRVALIEVESNPDFYWLQSADDGDAAFLAVVPWSFFTEFELVLSDDDQTAIELDDAVDAFVCCLVSGDATTGDFTANLRAPIVVNVRANRAKQVILPDEALSLQAPLG